MPPASEVIYIGCLMSATGERFERAVAIMERLRAPGGCPWDREQTFDSIKPYTLEETYEVLEAIDNRDWKELAGELGDLLLQVLFYAEMAKEQASFSIDDVLDRLSTKLIHRHPHVFGDVKADTSAEVKRNWEAIKVEEKKLEEKKKLEAGGTAAVVKDEERSISILAGVSSAMPSLLEASKLSSRAAQAGFDWPNVEGLFDKFGRRDLGTENWNAGARPDRTPMTIATITLNASTSTLILRTASCGNENSGRNFTRTGSRP